MIDVVTSTIKPTTWDTVGAPGSVTGNAFGTAKILIVAQTPEIHEEIADLLGHRVVTTTERYAQVDEHGLRALARPWPI